MFIPLDADNILCLANAAAIIKAKGGAVVLRTDGSRMHVPFSPTNLAGRHAKLAAEGKKRAEFLVGNIKQGAAI